MLFSGFVRLKRKNGVNPMAAVKTKKTPSREGELAPYLFHQGTNYHAQRYLGVHRSDEKDGSFRYTFRVWAPNAYGVSLVGDFVGWDNGCPMTRVTQGGVWEYTLESANKLEGDKYKFKVFSQKGAVYKADPYATYGETLKNTASIVHTESPFRWRDKAWLEKRKAVASTEHFYPVPMNIYEMHLASWRTRDNRTNKEGDAYLNYREIADLLVPYVKKLGYTHVEILPITEYPFDGSWGYQCCGYFAPTSRFGTPEDFKYFVNKLHTNGIGVIMDWVPAHFPKDAHGLYEFDGSSLYEYSGDDRREHQEWGTMCFDVARNEVQCFLVSSALYWLEEYHVDGLRVDAVASMLYLDYARKPGEWNPNVYGGNESLESIAFFQKLNKTVFGEHFDVLMIAEESTAFGRVTKPVHEGGLGFNFKWNMGWANDMYAYVQCDPFFRHSCHNKLNFSLTYAFTENYILPVSHDEVVHGKKSLLDKMYGSYEQKFAGDRLFMAYQILHPGKKMTFMGCEYGQFREWDYENALEWFMLDYEKHAKLLRYVEKLNHFYLAHSELWEIDDSWDGFEWIYPDRAHDNLLAFVRRNRAGEELVAVLNFSARSYTDYGVDVKGQAYREVFNTDLESFGGEGRQNQGILKAENGKIQLFLPPLSAVILQPWADEREIAQVKRSRTEAAGKKATDKKTKRRG